MLHGIGYKSFNLLFDIGEIKDVGEMPDVYYLYQIMKPNRRKFLGTAAALAAGTVAAKAMPFTSMENKYPVVHHVFFWLKNPDSKEDKDALIAGLKKLKKIETVKALHVGVVASTEKRDVVDTSWSVSELMLFSDLKGQEVYQTHPLHLEFIKICSPLWEKVVVYDVIEV